MVARVRNLTPRQCAATPRVSRRGNEYRIRGESGEKERSRLRIAIPVVLLALLSRGQAAAAAEPSGTVTWGVHVTLATRWLDTADTDAEITPFMVMYALHDALVKPMPGGLNTPSLAESWSMSRDGRTWEFVLRKGPKFHNGEPVTAEDVKFSFERYRGAAAPLFKARVREVQVVDASRVRFVLTEPWPDFMTFSGTSASGAAWIVPKRYVEKVGEDGFRRSPVGALIPAFPYSGPLEDVRLKKVISRRYKEGP